MSRFQSIQIGNAGPDVAKAFPMDNATDGLCDSISTLETLVSKLESRLERVMADRVGVGGVGGDDKDGAIRAAEAPLVEVINMHADRCQMLGNRIDNILVRLCL